MFENTEFEEDQRQIEEWAGSYVALMYWRGLKQDDFITQKKAIACYRHWDSIKDFTHYQTQEFELFIEEFLKAEAEDNRMKATLGLVGSKTQTHALIREMGNEFKRLGSKSNLTPAGQHRMDSLRGNLAVLYADQLTGSGNTVLLNEVANGKDLKSDTCGKGGEDSPQGQVWAEFCLWHVNHITLPTKTDLRQAVSFSQDHDRKHFSDYVKNLGLAGLQK